MGSRQRRAKTPPRLGNAPTSASEPAPQPRKAGKWKWPLRLALLVLAPLAALSLIEGVLWVVGYGYPAAFLVKAESADAYVPNLKFAWRFRCNESPDPFVIPIAKPPGTVRIFVFGESAAYGTPDPAYSFGRILELMLEAQYPQTRFEVITTAIMGINSHAVRPMVEECTAHDPDLFIFYMGNNEAVGFSAPGPESLGLAENLSLIRASLWLNTTRTGQLLSRLVRGEAAGTAKKPQDAEFFRRHFIAADDPRRVATCDNFAANLRDIFRMTRRAGVRTILSTVAVNLKDQPPFGSLHRVGLTEAETAAWEAAYAAGSADEDRGEFDRAIDRFRAALAIDDHFADLHFRLARCFFAAAQFDKAREHYQLACDWDAMPFRADRRLNRAIRELPHDSAAGVRLVDVERALLDRPGGDHGTPGESLFFEHVHFRFAGSYEVAKAIFPAASAAVAEVLNRPAPSAEVLSRDVCMAQLALTPMDEYLLLLPILEMTSRPPFTNELEHARRQQTAERSLADLRARLDPDVAQQAVAAYRQAIQRRPGDWHLHLRFAYLLNNVGDHAAAAAEYRTVLAKIPWHPDAQIGLQRSLAAASPASGGSGRSTKAVSNLQLQLDPQAMAHYRAGVELALQRKPVEAIAEYRQAIAISPNVSSFYNNLGAALLTAGQVDEAIVNLNKAVELLPDHGGAHCNLGLALLRRNDPAGAIGHLRRAADLKKCTPRALGQLAWLLATLPDDRLHNGVEAVRHAEEACRQTDRKVPQLLDILAAAEAEAGRFEDAVRTASEAIDVALASNDPELLGKIRQHRELYQRRQTLLQAK